MDVKEAKNELRQAIWRRIQDEGVARFPGAKGRIPNFVGAEAAAEMLARLDPWCQARHIKANPDSPQLPARRAALRQGSVVYMAVPRLRESLPFMSLDPNLLDVAVHRAASIKGASRYGRPIDIHDMATIDLVLAGSVAVSRDGARLGKGGGYSDLEFAIARQAGLISDDTAVITTAHPSQIVSGGEIPMTRHDVPLDFIITPDEIIPTSRAHDRPWGILWDELEEEKLRSIPVLKRLQAQA